MRPAAWLLAVAAVLATGAPAPAAEYARTITLREPLSYTWTDELVHRNVKVDEPHVAAKTFALAQAEGKRVPLQVEVLDGKPDAVRRVRLWWKATLPKDREVAYRLTYRDDGRAPEQPGEGLSVRRHEDRLILSTGAAEFLIPAPAKPFGGGVELKAAPAPVLGARPAGGKTWFGTWRLDGPARVAEIRTSVEADGPVWAGIRLTYRFDGTGKEYGVALRAVRGEPWLDVQETYRLGDGARAVLLLKDRLRPAEAIWLPWFMGTDGDVRAAYDVRREPLARKPRDGRPFATLRPKWTQARDNAQVCLAVGSGEGLPAVGAMMTCPADWAQPYAQFPVVRALEDGRAMAIEFPLAKGRRRWLLLAGPAATFDSKGKLQHLARRAADIPLDRVLNEWILDWKRDPAAAGPHLLTTRDRLDAIREAVREGRDTPAARLVKRLVAAESPREKRMAEFLAGRREGLGDTLNGTDMFLSRCYQDAFLSPASYPRRLAWAMAIADLSSAGRPAGGAAAAMFGYVFSDPNYWPGYAGGWDVGDPAWHVGMLRLGIYAAAMMPDHPHARRWMDHSLQGLHDELKRRVILPDGAGRDAPARQAAALARMLSAMRAAQNSGLADPFGWPEATASLEFLRNLHTPPDPRLGRRTLVPMGDAETWQDDVGRLFGIAAAGVRTSDPKRSRAWMAMYRDYYGDNGSGSLVADVLRADPSLPAGPLADADWTSRSYAGFGAVLRSRFGTPRETFVAMKCGEARAGYHGDELSFHFFGAAMPLALDWSSGSDLRPEQEHMHNRVNLGDDENMDATGRLLAMATSPVGDVVVGQVRSGLLRRMPRHPHEIAEGRTFSRRTLDRPARYRRLLMLVKHAEGSALEDYLVIRDEVAAREPATFNLHVLARSVRRDGQTLVFDGQLAADALLFLATPMPEKVILGRWGWPKQDASAMVPERFDPGRDRWRSGELQQWVRITETPGRPFLAVLYPYRKGEAPPTLESLADGKGVRVTLGKEREEVFLATDPPPEAGGQAVVRRNGQTTVILKAKAVPPL